MSEHKFEVLTGRLQILQRPTMWIGAIDKTKQKMFILSEDKVEHKEVEYVPGFKKIADEILDNSLDALIAHCNASGSIKVKIDEEKVSIEDDGPGIPVVKKKLSEIEEKNLPAEEAQQIKNSYLPQLAWTRLFSGSNFQDSENKTTIGAHGVGSTATAIFSTKFIGKTDDGKKSCTVKSLDNMEKVNCKVGDTSGKSGTIVEFWPDLKRFGLEKIDQVYFGLMYQRLLCLAITFPKIKFSFNGKKIDNNEKKFLKLFSENVVSASFSKGFIGIYPNDSDEFNFFTYVNGMHMSRGGSHIDYMSWQIVSPIRDKLVKKYKTIKPADIRNRLSMVVFMRDFPNPKFDSQTKETLTNAQSEVSSYLNGQIDFEKLAKDIMKNDAIMSPIIDMFKLKEELKARQELRQAKKIKVKSDKYMSPIGQSKYLFLCEGQCLENNTEVFSLVENQSVKVKDLNIGDLVLSHNQKIQQVVGKSSVIKKCVKIKTKSGKEVICSENHRWFVFDTNTNTFKFKKTKNLNVKTDKLVSNKLKYGFRLSDIHLTKWTGAEQNKYHFLMTGNGFEVATSSTHKFIVFDEHIQQFVVKQVCNINLKTDKLVLLEK